LRKSICMTPRCALNHGFRQIDAHTTREQDEVSGIEAG